MTNTLKIAFKSQDLRESLAFVASIVPPNPAQVSYSGVRIQKKDGGVILTSNNGDTTIVEEVDAIGNAELDVIIQPRPIINLLNKTQADDNITIGITDNKELSVSINDRKPYTFKTISTTFPALTVPIDTVIDVSALDLSKISKILRNSLQKDDPVVNVDINQEFIAFSTTDSYTISYTSSKQKSETPRSILVPFNVFEKAAKIKPSRIQVDNNNRVASFINESTKIITRLASTAYPPISTIIENTPENSVQLQTKDPLDILERISSISTDTPIKVTLKHNLLHIEIENADVGYGSEQCDIGKQVQTEISFYIKAQYLMSALSNNSEVTMSYSGPLQPLHFTSDEVVHNVMVVMPVRV